MRPRPNPNLALAAAALCAAALWPPQADAAKRKRKPNPYPSLVENSPFLTPAFKARLGRRDTVSMSFIGYTQIEGQWLFAVLERKGGKARWLKMEEEKEGIKIERFDEATQTLYLAVDGIGVELKLEKE